MRKKSLENTELTPHTLFKILLTGCHLSLSDVWNVCVLICLHTEMESSLRGLFVEKNGVEECMPPFSFINKALTAFETVTVRVW